MGAAGKPMFAVALMAALAFPVSALAGAPELTGRAILPADTFAPGPPSGGGLGSGPINGRSVPFSSQPVQGLSAVLDAGGGAFWAMPDNGYGSKAGSYDFLLRLYKIRPDLERAGGAGSGSVAVEDFISLSDPDGKVGFPIHNAGTSERLLTGADFDPESVRRDASGDLWFGDEFGPFLLHTDATGRLEEPPIPLPGVRSPEDPTRGAESPTLGSSSGFEGMALSTDAPAGCIPPGVGEPQVLYPVLEDALNADPDRRRRYVYAFSLAQGAYGPERWQYRTDNAAHRVADVASVDPNRLLVLERDNLQGTAAAFKRVFLVDLRETDLAGFLVKRPVADLLNLGDPQGISLPAAPGDIGLGDPFRFPFGNVESLLPLAPDRLVVLNDNNYPFDKGGRDPDVDDTEVIEIAVDDLCARVQPPPPEPPPDPGLPPPSDPPLAGLLPDRIAPVISRFGISRSRFRVVVRRPRAALAGRGTVFRFRVSEPARMQLTFRRGPRRFGSLVRLKVAGPGAIRFTGRVGRRVLRPGRYRATLVARDRAGNPSRPKTLNFRVVE